MYSPERIAAPDFDIRELDSAACAGYGVIRRWPDARYYGIVRGGTLLGRIVIFPSDDQGFREIRYSLEEAERGEHLAERALKRFVEIDHPARLKASVESQNVASCKTLERCGFSKISRSPDGGTVEYQYISAERNS